MTTAKQTAANQRNAARSTGPKTAGGRARSSKNALSHGIASLLPVLPGLEREQDWEDFRAGIVGSLAPAGTLEATLAGRVALCAWRLDRAARYETAVTAAGLERIEEETRPIMPTKADADFVELDDDNIDEISLGKALKRLEKKQEVIEIWQGTLRLLESLHMLPDETPVDPNDVDGVFSDLANNLPDADKTAFDYEDKDFLASLGLPQDAVDEGCSWDGWTAGMVRKAVAKMAAEKKINADTLLAKALKGREQVQTNGQEKVKALERRVKELRRQQEAKKDRMQRERILPSGDTLQKITRYESHLSRQMYLALHELQRLQAVRGRALFSVPAALDVTLDASESAAEALETAAAV